jgi:hypothetical protein
MTGILESWSHQLRNDTKMLSQLKSYFFFHRHIYSLSHGLGRIGAISQVTLN